MRALYKSYQLPVDEYNLRVRIGVDKPTVPFVNSTMGSIHPDLLRVLDQDGFKYEVVDMKNDNVHLKLANHLKSEHYAMILLKLNNGIMHWVVVSDEKDDRYTIVDSLKKEPHKLSQSSIDKQLIGVVLIEPQPSEGPGMGKSLRTGLWEGLKSLFR
jgi:ABC-type bacteriocin/lantibiotic exporter with double-glycine peptidase domain